MIPKGIIVHCSDSPQGRGDTASTLHEWHLERGWNGLGYHYIILENGNIERGRPDFWQGSHARGYNDWLGICMIGIDSFTEEQLYALEDLIKSKMLEYKLSTRQVRGHNQIDDKKSCPNININEFMAERRIR